MTKNEVLIFVLIGLVSVCRSDRLFCPQDSAKSWPPNRVNTTNRLIWLRNEMSRTTSVRGPVLDAFIITTDDEHQNEFLADRDKRLRYISGFSGQGLAVITRQKAALWVDSAYHDRADQELDCNWTLLSLEDSMAPTLTQWLKKELKHGYRVGADSRLVPSQTWDSWIRELANERIALIETPNLIDVVWTIGRPSYSQHSAFIIPVEYAGETWQTKVGNLRSNLSRIECDAMVVTALDEIAWLLNVRGKDMPFSPFVRSYLIVTKDEVHWYVPKEKLTDSVKRQLKVDTYGPYNVRVHSYDSIWTEIRTLSQVWKKVLIPGPCVFSPGASQAIFSAVPPEKRLLKQSPIIFLKAKKNPVEIEGMRRANLRDSMAFVDFLAELDDKMQSGSNWTETSIVKMMEHFRLEQNITQGIPFPSVAAFGKHSALSRYEPSNLTDAGVQTNSTLLLKSGGHYYDGTGFVARTLHFGTPTRNQIEAYTKVLAALIGFSGLTFPTTVKTSDIDLISRMSLWKSGISYKHATGHGIGAFSTIRESPVLIDYESKPHKQAFKEGYFFVIEPSFSKEGEYGIQLGNVLEVVNTTLQGNDSQPRMFRFRDATLVPFDTNLIDATLLSRNEVQWLNQYHSRVMLEVGPELQKKKHGKSYQWLQQKTRPMSDECSSGHVWSGYTWAYLPLIAFCSWIG